MGHIKSRGWMRLLPFLAVLGSFALPHLAHAQSQYQTCAFSDPTHCYGIGPGTAGQAYVSNGQAYPSFSSSLPGVTSVGGVTIPATASVFLTGPTTTTATLCFLSTTTAGLGSWGSCSGGSGGVSTVSVVSANGLSGTVANPTTTPAITLAPTFTGWAYSNGSGFAAATLTGDCSFTLEAITCLDSNGVPIVTTTGTQTLTNKSISGSEINSGTVGTTYGGTGLATYAAGDLLYAPSTNTLSALAPTTNGYVLTLVSGLPAWAPSSGGSGTVNSGTEGDFAYYATTGTAVSPLSPAAVQAALVAANAISYTPTLASGATNDWDPSGGAGITTVGVAWTTPNSAGSTVDGILSGSATQQIKLCNAATLGTNGSYIILENQDSSDSTAANRLMGPGNQALGPQMCVMLTYLAGTVDRWEMGRIEDAGTPATQPLATGTSMTPDCSFKLVTETASAAGTFTINAPTDCTPQNGQRIELDITNYSASASTLSWNSAYMASSSVALPTAGSAAADEDDFVFSWSAALSKWKLLAYNLGF